MRSPKPRPDAVVPAFKEENINLKRRIKELEMNNNDEYIIKIHRYDFEHKVTDAQWERFTKLMDEDVMEYSPLHEAIERNLEQAMEEARDV